MKLTLNKVSLFLLILAVVIPVALPVSVAYWRQIRKGQGDRGYAQPNVTEAPGPMYLELSDLQVTGSTSAKVALIEFSDFECPFCRQHARTVGLQLHSEFVDLGKMRYAFANNPLDMHPGAKLLAAAAFCGGEQGQFWQMYRKLFADQPRDSQAIHLIAEDVVPNVHRFDECLVGEKPSQQIETDLKLSKEFNLLGTPAFGLGRIDANGRVKIEKLILGAQKFEVFSSVIHDLLSQAP